MATSESHVRAAPGLSRHLLSIVALPFMNTVIIPAAILSLTRGASVYSWLANGGTNFVCLLVGSLLAAAGVFLVITSIGWFVRIGQGTLAPWDPPRKLVAIGVYSYVRNPMKAGLILILLAESLIFRSPPLAGWFAAFSIANVLYIHFSEEPGLLKRFGQDYVAYCAAVPRWFPRLEPTTWRPKTRAHEQ